MNALFFIITLATPVLEAPKLHARIALPELPIHSIDQSSLIPADLLPDGRIVVRNIYTAVVLDGDGKELTRFGRRGQGPGEFQFLGSVILHDGRYWCQDRSVARLSVFDEAGRFITWHATPGMDQILDAGGNLFVPMHHDLAAGKPYLYTLTYSEKGLAPAKAFHPLPPQSTAWNFNNRAQRLAVIGNRIFVFPELSGNLEVYALETLAHLDSHSVPLPHWAKAPDQWMHRGLSTDRRIRWWNSWSRVLNIFALTEESLLIYYGTPNPDDPYDWTRRVLRIGTDGKAQDTPRTFPGIVFGTRAGQVYVLAEKESDTEGFYDHEIQIYTW